MWIGICARRLLGRLPTASRRYGRLPICATVALRERRINLRGDFMFCAELEAWNIALQNLRASCVRRFADCQSAIQQIAKQRYGAARGAQRAAN